MPVQERRADGDSPRRLEPPDGPPVAYAEYGAPEGDPVVCLHGNPGSRRLWEAYDEAARERGLRLLAPDRPGFGQSPDDPTQSVGAFPETVTALVDEVGADRFGVVGFSAGGAHAAAVAATVPDRVRTAALVSSVAPPPVQRECAGPRERLGQVVLQHVPGAARAMFGLASAFAEYSPEHLERTLRADASRHDEELFDGPAGELLLADAAAAFRQGSRGPAREYRQLGSDWGVDLQEPHAPLSLWHGRNDGSVPCAHARATETHVRDADLTVVTDGHYSTLLRNADAILADVAP